MADELVENQGPTAGGIDNHDGMLPSSDGDSQNSEPVTLSIPSEQKTLNCMLDNADNVQENVNNLKVYPILKESTNAGTIILTKKDDASSNLDSFTLQEKNEITTSKLNPSCMSDLLTNSTEKRAILAQDTFASVLDVLSNHSVASNGVTNNDEVLSEQPAFTNLSAVVDVEANDDQSESIRVPVEDAVDSVQADSVSDELSLQLSSPTDVGMQTMLEAGNIEEEVDNGVLGSNIYCEPMSVENDVFNVSSDTAVDIRQSVSLAELDDNVRQGSKNLLGAVGVESADASSLLLLNSSNQCNLKDEDILEGQANEHDGALNEVDSNDESLSAEQKKQIVFDGNEVLDEGSSVDSAEGTAAEHEDQGPIMGCSEDEVVSSGLQTCETIEELDSSENADKEFVEDLEYTVEIEPEDLPEAIDANENKQSKHKASSGEIELCSALSIADFTSSSAKDFVTTNNSHVTENNDVQPLAVEKRSFDKGFDACEAPVSDVGSCQKEGSQAESAVDFERGLQKINECKSEVARAKTSLTEQKPEVFDLDNEDSPTVAEKTPVNSAPKADGLSKPGRTQECIVCKMVVKCKYNIVRNGDTKHLCDDNCFKIFRAQPTNFLQSDSTKSMVTNMNKAAGMYKVLCDYCHQAVENVAATGRCVLKVGKESKQFCRQLCLNEFKRIKQCDSCGKDVLGETIALTSINKLPSGVAEVKGFCSRACCKRYTSIASTQEQVSPCSVCGKVAPVRREVNMGGVVHHLCGEPCFSAFRYANKLPSDVCDECQIPITSDVLAANIIQFDGATRKFCGTQCLNSFRNRRQVEVTCEWCGSRRSNFEMLEHMSTDNGVQRFCSLNCLSLFRVNLQANSGNCVVCDQCQMSVPAQYHLTMSDASVRNFCSYPCVAAFQGQFSLAGGTSPAAPIVAAPVPGPKVTANTVNTIVSNTGAIPAPITLQPQSAKTSVYGTRQSTRVQAKQVVPLVTSKQSKPSAPVTASRTSPGMIISSIVSLAQQQKGSNQNILNAAGQKIGATGQKAGAKTASAATVASSTHPQSLSVATTPQVIVQPPAPKELRNKALLCKPFMQTKATSCRPHSITKGTQTEENWEPKRMLLPCPVPMMMPAPMAMYTTPTPLPIIIPVPIPVPCFIPTSRKTSKKIFKKIKEMQERMPSDPFEAELLMMAEAVASGGARGSESDSDASEDAPDNYDPPSPEEPTPAVLNNVANTNTSSGGNGELGEDMLQMALRMASEMTEEPVLDLEDNVDAAPVRRVERPPAVQEFSTISHDNDIIQAVSPVARGRGASIASRGKRRSSAGAASSNTANANRNRSAAKKPRVDEITVPSQAIVLPTASSVIPQVPADANCMLKFTYGVNAFKHWVIQKNALIEKATANAPVSRMISRSVRPLKLDPLHCTADELNCALCMFVREVRKPNGEQYAPDSILYLCLGIQQYLFENNRIDNIFTDFFYERFTECLNEILTSYEVSLNTQGLLVCRIEEEHLWESKQLGAHSPHVLLNTLIYFNTKHFMLRTPVEHLALSFSHIMKHWKKTSSPSGKQGRSVYLRYYSPAQSNAVDASGQKRRKEEMPVFEQAENVDNPLRCPVKLYEFYLSKCPESIKNRNDVFYLVPERSCVPDSPVWYSTMSLGIEAMTKMLNRLRPVREIQEAHIQASQIGTPGSYFS